MPNDERGTDNTNSGNLPTSVSQTCEPCGHQTEPNSNKKKSKEKWTRLQVLTLIFDAVVATATISAVCVYRGQLKTMNQQVKDSETATIDAARTQILDKLPLASAAGNSLHVRTNPDGSMDVIDRQSWSNFGETRAVAPQVEWGWSNKRLSRGSSLQWHPKTWEKSTWVKGVTIFDEQPLTVEEMKEFSKLQEPLFVCGRIRYTDVFPDHIGTLHRRNDHLVEYCIRIVEVAIDLKEKRASWGGEELPDGYCYDEQCGEDY
jgi:hypothetical protein